MTVVTPIRTPAESALIAAFEQVKDGLPGGAEATALRAASFERFVKAGLPHRRVEDWKYSDLRAVMREVHPLAGEPDRETLVAARQALADLPRTGGSRFVVLDGRFRPDLSDMAMPPIGVTVGSLAELLPTRPDLLPLIAGADTLQKNVAFALNGAFLNDGVVIEIAAHTEMRHAIDLVSMASTGGARFISSRNLMIVGEKASVGLVETHIGPNGVDYQKNAVLQIAVGAGAIVEHGRRILEGDRALHVSTLASEIAEGATFDSLTLTTGGAFDRNQLFVRFTGAHARATLRGVSMLRGRQHADTTLVMEHLTPHCDSREKFKHILDDEAHGVFQGKIIVAPQAQKTDGRMMSQAIMLAEGPSMDNKPELEIFADDVACAHGCTVGGLDPDLMFYLNARGIPRTEAEALLIEAFAREAIEDFGAGPLAVVDELREAMLGTVKEWMLARS